MNDRNYQLWIERYSGWIAIWVLCGLVVLRWLMLMPLADHFGSINLTIGSLGKLSGLVGIMLYAINLILSARLRWLENMFGGLNRVYIAHHLTGGVALVLLAFHPLFLALRYITWGAWITLKDAAVFLLPRSIDLSQSFDSIQEAVSLNNGIVAFIGMVVLLVLTFFVDLPYRIWLFTHKFLGVAFAFAGWHVLFISSDVARDPILRGYILIWIVLGLTAYIYRTLLGNIFVRRAPYKVEKIDVLNDTISISMAPMDKPLQYQPGQFVFARFLWSAKDGIIREAHPFSISSAPQESNMRIHIKALGDFTTSLKRLQVGTVVELEGAFGRFLYNRFKDTPQVWIAGGIGITPFLSMARSLTADAPPIDLFYSVQKRTELLDEEVLTKTLPAALKQFHYHPTVTDESKKFLTADQIKTTVGELKGREIFLCGPPPMMKAIRKQLRSLGVPNHRIHSEEFSMQ